MTTITQPTTRQPILDLREQLDALLSCICNMSMVWKEWDKEMDVLLGYKSGKYVDSHKPKPTTEYIRKQHKIGGHWVLEYQHKVIQQIGKTVDSLRGIATHLQFGMGDGAGVWETRVMKMFIVYRDELREHMPGDVITRDSENVDEWMMWVRITPPEVRSRYEAFKRFHDANWKRLTSDLMDNLECCAVETATPTSSRKVKQKDGSAEANALKILMDNPFISMKQLAAETGVDERTPYRWKTAYPLWKSLQEDRRLDIHKGSKDGKTGDIEAANG